MDEKEENVIKRHYKKNKKKLICFAYKYIKSWEASEDLVQDFFSGLIEKLKNEDIEITTSYLFICIRYKSLDYIRKKKNSIVEPINLAKIDEFVIDSRSLKSLEEATIEGCLVDKAYEIISTFPEKEIEIFFRREYKGHKLSRISKDLKQSNYQINKILDKIKLTLREEFENYNTTDYK